jgi:hypothetical protein
MCGGGGGQRATIVQPDYRAFDQQFELQKAAIDQGMNSGAQQLQQGLVQAQQQQQQLLENLRDVKKQRADNVSSVSAQAVRMASLVGAPPPEKSAKAPVVGRERNGSKTKGKAALRIVREMASSSGQGTGLNIT